MQIVKIFAFSAFITLFQIRGCNNIEGVSNSATVEKNRPIMTSIPAQIDYKLASRDCFAEESCLAFVSVKKKFQNEKALVDLSEFLNSKRPKKGKLIVYFFETFNTAKAFADVKIPPRDLEFYAIGVYRIDEKEEYLKVPVTIQKPFDPSEKRPEWRFVFKRERAFKEDRVNEPSH